MQVQTYLFLEGRCDEAITFYQQAVGAEVLMRLCYGDAPDQTNIPPGSAGKVMHASIRIGDSVILASDGHCSGATAFGGFALSLTVDGAAAAERAFDALAAGGTVRMPMAPTFFADRFGMLTDRFGVLWMVMTQQASPAEARHGGPA